jgi:hypothetical protein
MARNNTKEKYYQIDFIHAHQKGKEIWENPA